MPFHLGLEPQLLSFQKDIPATVFRLLLPLLSQAWVPGPLPPDAYRWRRTLGCFVLSPLGVRTIHALSPHLQVLLTYSVQSFQSPESLYNSNELNRCNALDSKLLKNLGPTLA